MNDLTQLNAKIDALSTKVTETNATLAGLAQAVIDLKNSADSRFLLLALFFRSAE